MADEKKIKLLIEAILKDAKFKKGLKNAQSEMNKTSKVALGLKNVLANAFAVIGIGSLITAFRSAVKTVMDFEQAAKNASAISGIAFEDISKIAMKAGKETAFTAKEAADGLTELARAGVATAGEMESILVPAIRLANVGQLNLADSTQKIIQTANQFNMGLDQSNEIIDILAKGANSATTTVSNLSQALKFAGPVAGQVNISLTDTITVLDQLFNSGQQATQAGRIFRLAISRLAAGIPAVQKELLRYNITQEQVNQSLNDPVKLFKLLQPAVQDYGSAVKILGTQGVALAKIIKQGSGSFEEMRKKILGAKSAAELEKEMLQTMEGQARLLNSAIQNLLLVLTGQSGLSGGFQQVTGDIRNMINEIADWLQTAEGIKTINDTVAVLVFLFKSLWNVGKIVWTSLSGVIQQVSTGIAGFAQILSDLVTGNFERIGPVFQETMDSIRNQQDMSAKKILNSYENIGNDASAMWKKLGQTYEDVQQDMTTTTQIEGRKQVQSHEKMEKAKTQISKEESEKRKKGFEKASKIIKNEIKSRLDEIKRQEKEIVDFSSNLNKMSTAEREQFYQRFIELEKETGKTIEQIRSEAYQTATQSGVKFFKKLEDLQTNALLFTHLSINAEVAAREQAENRIRKLREETQDKYKLDLEEATQLQQSELDKRTQKIEKQKNIAAKAVTNVASVVGEVGGAIGGEIGELVGDVANLATQIASGDPWKAMQSIATFAIKTIVSEFQKNKREMQLIDEMAAERTKILEEQKLKNAVKNLKIKQEAEKKALEEKQRLELEDFENNSLIAKRRKELLKREEQERIASMSKEEREKYEIEKQYEMEREKLLAEQAEKKLKLEEEQKKKRNEIMKKQFEAEKKIAIEEAEINFEQTKAEISKEFWAPWRRKQRNNLINMAKKVLNSTKSAIASRVFVPEFAKGTQNTPEGAYIVGDEGPEMMFNKPGRQVVSNSDLMRATMAGLKLDRQQTNNVINNDNRSATNRATYSFAGANFILKDVTNPRQLFQDIVKEADAMGVKLLAT